MTYLKDINNLKKSDTCKIRLTIAINVISSKDNDEEPVMHSKSDNVEIMINDKADIKELYGKKVVAELFKPLIKKY